MFGERGHELDQLLHEARRLCAQQADAAAHFGRTLRITHFGLYLAGFAVFALVLNQAHLVGLPMIVLLGLALGITVLQLRAASIELTLPRLGLPQVDVTERVFALRAVVYRASLRGALWLAWAHELVLRLRATELLAQFKLPQLAHVTTALARAWREWVGETRAARKRLALHAVDVLRTLDPGTVSFAGHRTLVLRC
jgi:hypothetical protein